MEWHAFEVDGETFYWTACVAKSRTGDGPWVVAEMLHVSRARNAKGVGRSYRAGTIITVEYAIDTMRLFKEHGRVVP